MNDDGIIAPYNWVGTDNIIKVIGVGGGGCNAVDHMYRNKDINGADFIVCNTDRQALEKCSVPNKITIGSSLTKGLGAGCDPFKGRKAALESHEDIEKLFADKTEMVFITCGMGGGTGTGAAPVIADIAHKAGLLTVGVVTIPFEDEGNEFMSRAIEGIHEMEKCVDSLLIINNQKLYEVYGHLPIHEAFPKADEVLETAVRGITEIIMDTGYINVDFADVSTVMRGSGMALMGSGRGSGDNRVEDAVEKALSSPLLNDFDLTTARNVLINIRTTKDENGLSTKELSEIVQCIQRHTGNAKNFKRGVVYDESGKLEKDICITVIATGFNMDLLPQITKRNRGNIIYINDNYISDTLNRTKHKKDSELELRAFSKSEAGTLVIGKTTSTNIRTFHYAEPPVLISGMNGKLSELENTPAIRRSDIIPDIELGIN